MRNFITYVMFIILSIVALTIWHDFDNRLAQQKVELILARYDIEKLKARQEKIDAGFTILMVPYKISGDTSWYFVGGLKVMHIKRDSLLPTVYPTK